MFNIDSWMYTLGADWPVMGNWIAQLLVLFIIGYLFYQRFIRYSQAEQLLKGVSVIFMSFVLLWTVSHSLELQLLATVFEASIYLFMIGLIVIFQPELRRILLYLGQPELFGKSSFAATSKEKKAEYLVSELCDAVRFLSRSKTGALIVLESENMMEGNYLEAGTKIDARLSAELLLTIFHTNTPLHDGAVVINSENRLISAGVLLPLTEDPKLSWQFGTRHRAAIGLTESSDSRCVVVSEETGGISLVDNGELEKIANTDELNKRLRKIYNIQDTTKEKIQRKVLPFSQQVSGFFSQEIPLPSRLQKLFFKGDSGSGSKKSSSS